MKLLIKVRLSLWYVLRKIPDFYHTHGRCEKALVLAVVPWVRVNSQVVFCSQMGVPHP